MLKIIINTDNAAFEDGCKELEVARIIAVAADKVEGDCFDSKLYDINGNPVGRLAENDNTPDMESGRNYVTLEIKTDNAAFDDNGKGGECACILRQAAAKMRDGDLDFNLRDSNGNIVGKVQQVVGEVVDEAAPSEKKEALSSENGRRKNADPGFEP